MAPRAPDTGVAGAVLDQVDEDATVLMHHQDETEEFQIDINFRRIYHDLKHLDWSKVVWRNVIIFALLHVYAIYGAWLVLSLQTQWKTILWVFILHINTIIGTTMGAHRLWAHRSYTARMPLKIYLMICQTIAIQNNIYEWSRDHRMHHKFSDTDADPHNIRRGFFFSHIGWLMYRKHPKISQKGKGLDLSDLKADSVVMWQKQNYLWVVIVMCFMVPTIVPMYFWGESLFTAFMVTVFFRYTIFLHTTWSLNSVLHWTGPRPFDKTILPVQNKLLHYLTLGEGWHNYHHVFPWDYRASELSGWITGILDFNCTAILIDLCAAVGLASDTKRIPPKTWRRRLDSTGDGSYIEYLDDTTTIANND